MPFAPDRPAQPPRTGAAAGPSLAVRRAVALRALAVLVAALAGTGAHAAGSVDRARGRDDEGPLRRRAASPKAGLARAAVGVTHGTVKIRPDSVPPAARTIALDAARNEFEPFQIVIAGRGEPVPRVSARAGDLEGPGGARIAASNLRLFAERLYEIPARGEGERAAWPDALVAEVDGYAGERRSAFPFDVPAGEARAIWIDVFVPPGARPGPYRGVVEVRSGGDPLAAIEVRLRVRRFTLPSTASLRSAFGFSVDVACRAHLGTRFCEGDAAAAPLVRLYTRAALLHRVTLATPYYTLPQDGGFRRFDETAGPFLAGDTAGPLGGARLTTFRSGYRRDADPAWTRARTAALRAHFAARRWPQELFDQVFDEPHACVPQVRSRAAVAHAAGVRTLVTTDLDRVDACGWRGDVDIVCPVVNQLERRDRGGLVRERARYDEFLARPGKELWWYQSCMSHGCQPEGECAPAQGSSAAAGWPSYAVDASAVQARAMEWLSFGYGFAGELYYDAVMNLDRAWRPGGLCAFGAHGDGALFYPGDPRVIGGRTWVPVESLRLKLLREGMEDYEYLHLLAALGEPRAARDEARRLFPAADRVTSTSPEALYAARRRVADRIERLLAPRASDRRR
ncbi:glycoside hydrolase domain-containing protein [Anaeromyxobacter oryzisoli]|uniref:glycoside hydrolase domain-containing protein n=1 Tax=Anaeromyxobacter oryzisoli TaxID=2925408 RepID=UPI001F5628C0|nr:glycoside hydrolase domain-containing protein [Anaeromyxobacter sp. SG63]